MPVLVNRTQRAYLQQYHRLHEDGDTLTVIRQRGNLRAGTLLLDAAADVLAVQCTAVSETSAVLSVRPLPVAPASFAGWCVATVSVVRPSARLSVDRLSLAAVYIDRCAPAHPSFSHSAWCCVLSAVLRATERWRGAW